MAQWLASIRHSYADCLLFGEWERSETVWNSACNTVTVIVRWRLDRCLSGCHRSHCARFRLPFILRWGRRCRNLNKRSFSLVRSVSYGYIVCCTNRLSAALEHNARGGFARIGKRRETKWRDAGTQLEIDKICSVQTARRPAAYWKFQSGTCANHLLGAAVWTNASWVAKKWYLLSIVLID